MNRTKPTLGIFAAITLSGLGILPSHAVLPLMEGTTWLGQFLGYDSKRYQFTFSRDGKAAFLVSNSKGNSVSNRLSIPILFGVEETTPDGKTVQREVIAESLECDQPASTTIRNVLIRGKVNGGASIEILLNESRGGISMTGRITNAAELKNPSKFNIRVRFPNAYPPAARPPTPDKKEKKDDRKKDPDLISLRPVDGPSVKLGGNDLKDLASPEVTGNGISIVTTEFASHQGRELTLTAAPASSMRLKNDPTKPLKDGFHVYWSTDPAKDPKNAATLTIDAK